MKMFRCDVCGQRLNRPEDCFVTISAHSSRVDDRTLEDKKLRVNERYEICPECWKEVRKAVGEVLEKLGGE